MIGMIFTKVSIGNENIDNESVGRERGGGGKKRRMSDFFNNRCPSYLLNM